MSKPLTAIEQRLRLRELANIQKILAMPEGRELFWRILSYTSVFGQEWEASAKIHFVAGKRDVGIWLLKDLEAASPGTTITMMSENRIQEEALEKEKKS